jgi:MFS family permease
MFGTAKFGRRFIVFLSSIICSISLFVVTIISLFDSTTALQNFCIFTACIWSLFNSALGVIGWAFVGEIASQKLRARTAGLAAGLSVVFGLSSTRVLQARS